MTKYQNVLREKDGKNNKKQSTNPEGEEETALSFANYYYSNPPQLSPCHITQPGPNDHLLGRGSTVKMNHSGKKRQTSKSNCSSQTTISEFGRQNKACDITSNTIRMEDDGPSWKGVGKGQIAGVGVVE